MDRTALVEAAQAGSPGALAALVDEFAPTVLGAAYGWSGDRDLAADIAQEAFAVVVARIGDVRVPAAFPGWLMAVVRTAAARAHRTRVVTARLDERAAETPGPEASVVRADELERVRLAVESLPPHLRLPVVLHYAAGCTVAEIADLSDAPVSTVKQRMRVARARLREGMDDMAEEMLCRLRPDEADDPSDVIRFYVAMRTGDTVRVAAILDARPDLVDVREHWTREDSFAHRLPWTGGGGTPLLRAIERGDDAMVSLLLERGADPNGACACAGGERPLWTAAANGRTSMIDDLLHYGADPDGTAFEGTTALRVAMIRGDGEMAAKLLAVGARDVTAWEPATSTIDIAETHPAVVTGIKTVDLWCPLPASGLARLTPGFGLGAVVLLGELSHRWVASGRNVVWTGFVPAPTDETDMAHALAESGLDDRVRLVVAAPTTPRSQQIAAFDRGIDTAGDDALLVVFEETGFGGAIDERVARLAQRSGTTIVVGPLDGTVAPPVPKGSPYLASITFDVERARRGQWPAVGHEGSWSKAMDGDGASLAAAARDVLAGGGDAATSLHECLSQPFFIAEAVLDVPGEFVPRDDLRAELAAIVQPNA